MREWSDLPWMAAIAGDGVEVEVTLVREGKKIVKAVVMGDLADAGRTADKKPELTRVEGNTLEGAGLTLGDLSPPERLKLRSPPTYGVSVTGVAPGSVAAEAGFRPGDVILRMGTAKAKDVASVLERYARVKVGTPVPFHVLRGGALYQWLAFVKK